MHNSPIQSPEDQINQPIQPPQDNLQQFLNEQQTEVEVNIERLNLFYDLLQIEIEKLRRKSIDDILVNAKMIREQVQNQQELIQRKQALDQRKQALEEKMKEQQQREMQLRQREMLMEEEQTLLKQQLELKSQNLGQRELLIEREQMLLNQKLQNRNQNLGRNSLNFVNINITKELGMNPPTGQSLRKVAPKQNPQRGNTLLMQEFSQTKNQLASKLASLHNLQVSITPSAETNAKNLKQNAIPQNQAQLAETSISGANLVNSGVQSNSNMQTTSSSKNKKKKNKRKANQVTSQGNPSTS